MSVKCFWSIKTKLSTLHQKWCVWDLQNMYYRVNCCCNQLNIYRHFQTVASHLWDQFSFRIIVLFYNTETKKWVIKVSVVWALMIVLQDRALFCFQLQLYCHPILMSLGSEDCRNRIALWETLEEGEQKII